MKVVQYVLKVTLEELDERGVSTGYSAEVGLAQFTTESREVACDFMNHAALAAEVNLDDWVGPEVTRVLDIRDAK